MRLTNALLLGLVLGLGSWARADIFVLNDDRTIEGEIESEDATQYVVRGRFGKTIIKKEEVREIQKTKSTRATFIERSEALEKGDKKDDAKAWAELAAFAKQEGLQDEMRRAYQQVVKLDPQHADAHTALGHVRYLGNWMTPEERRKLEGQNAQAEAPKGGDAQAATPAVPAAEPAGGGVNREALTAATGLKNWSEAGEKPVNCPKCNGTAIAIMIGCVSCQRSAKPGYKNMGDHYTLCDTCAGRGKIVGAMCDFCKRTGKILPSEMKPADGGSKKPPGGYAWCSVCNGCGVESWLECLQCKRSKTPGYNWFGDRIEVCQKCSGTTKVAAMGCGKCGGKGIVPAGK